MNTDFIYKNIVILGEFNPGFYDKFFFIKHNFVQEDEFYNSSLFLPNLSIVETDNFVIEISEIHARLDFKIQGNSIPALLLDTIIQNAAIFAFGFNFKLLLFLNTISDSRKHFYITNSPINKFFDTDDAAYGYYVSRNYEDSRLKLEIKPVVLEKLEEGNTVHALDFTFNYHFELSNIREYLNHYKKYEDFAIQIVQSHA